MTNTYIVILKSSERMDDLYCYGPFNDLGDAKRFADFLTKEVDPAIACLAHSPVRELLNWRESQ